MTSVGKASTRWSLRGVDGGSGGNMGKDGKAAAGEGTEAVALAFKARRRWISASACGVLCGGVQREGCD